MCTCMCWLARQESVMPDVTKDEPDSTFLPDDREFSALLPLLTEMNEGVRMMFFMQHCCLSQHDLTYTDPLTSELQITPFS